MKNLGKIEEQYRRSRTVSRQSVKSPDTADPSDEFSMPMFQVFEVEVVRQYDSLPTDGYNRKSHHHLHKDMRYSLKKD